MDLPIYNIKVDDLIFEDGVQRISLVNEPAIEEKFITLSKDKIFLAADVEKKELVGPFLVPDKLIYRNVDGYEFYIKFNKEDIEIISSKWMREGKMHNFNLEHEDITVPAYLKENWIIEDENDKSSKYGFDLPLGTWMGKIKIEDDNFWSKYVKAGKVKGFSVELMASALELQLNKNKLSSMDKVKLQEEVVGATGATATAVEEVSTIDTVVEEQELTVEEEVMAMLTPITEKYDAMLEGLQMKINELESIVSEMNKKEEVVDEAGVQPEVEQEIVELKKQVQELSKFISTNTKEVSVDKSNDLKLKREQDLKSKLEFLVNRKK